MKEKDIKKEYSSEIEIMIHGMRRSGNHIIIEWIINSLDKKYLFLNDLSTREVLVRSSFFNFYSKGDYINYFIDELQLQSLSLIRNTKKELFIYSLEDYRFENIDLFKSENNFGSSQKFFDILIIRDPFNLFVSRIKSKMLSVKSAKVDMVGLWKDHAKEYLKRIKIPKSKLVINYNKFISDYNYRSDIANLLGCKSNEDVLKKVPKPGKGSSFNNFDFDGKGTEIKVLERWKEYLHDEFYMSIFKDKELIELSEKIFGVMPGTEVFYKK